MSPVENLWRDLEGAAVDDQIRLGQMQAGQPAPTFAGFWHKDGTDVPVVVRFWPDEAELGSIYDRHREAMFLRHPNLLRCLGVNRVTMPDGSRAIYAIYEQPQTFLAAFLEDRAFTPSEAATLCEDVIAGLRHLHQNGLVYCNLDKSTIAHAGDRWALCDYSQLRPEGTGYAAETRRLMGSIAGAPPEAFNGIVMPAWDVWGLAHLIRSVFQDPKTARELRAATASGRVPRLGAAVPEPFAAIASNCLVPDPGARCSLDDIERQVKKVAHAPEPPVVVPSESSAAARLRETSRAANIAEPAPNYHQPRRRDDEPDEPGRFSHIAWRPLLAGAALVLLIATLVGISRRGQNEPKNATVPAVQQQQAEGPDTRPAPVDPAPATAGSAEPRSTRSRIAETGSTSPEARNGSAVQVEKVVQQWVEAFRRKDLNAGMHYYGPRLRRFYRMSNVSYDFVQRTKSAALKDAGTIRQYQISDMQTHLDSTSAATVTFDKAWEFVGKFRNTGKVREELKLEKHGDKWQIVSERDLKVYHQSRTRA